MTQTSYTMHVYTCTHAHGMHACKHTHTHPDPTHMYTQVSQIQTQMDERMSGDTQDFIGG